MANTLIKQGLPNSLRFKTHASIYLRYFMIVIDIISLTGTWLSNTLSKTICQRVRRGKIQNSNHLHNEENMMQSTFENV